MNRETLIENDINIEGYLLKIENKTSKVIDRIGEGIPYIARDGKYTDVAKEDISWWTNGFFSGLLWQLYHVTRNKKFLEKAIQIENKLDEALSDFVGLHHDVGFMWLHTAVAHYREIPNAASKLRAIKAANILVSRFNTNGEFIRCWNEDHDGWTIIDSMMNVQLLYWATNESGDSRFRQVAEKQADTIAENLIRDDGSVAHIGSFDANNGEFIEVFGGQGFDSDSSWSRGQSWAIYGFALSYRHTKKKKYLDVAKKVANYFLANVALSEFVPCVDFRAPATSNDTDTSAGLIAVCGFLELVEHVQENEQKLYLEGAKKIIIAILKRYCNFNPEIDGFVTGGAVSYHGDNNVCLVYSDYFLIEALLRLNNLQADLW